MGRISGLACRRGAGGQGMTEYLIILALIAIAAIGVYSFFGQSGVHQPPAAAVAKIPPDKAGAKDAPGAPAHAAAQKADQSAAQAPLPGTPPVVAQDPAQAPPAQPAAAKEAGDTKAAGSK